ncbi:hypothetical protein QP246_02580 [Aerococcus urinae]|uniref:sigma-70 region 4 domain-containing protein n=1 Tax=Aerococcus urinae TaxID=1376 RepID=UPI00254A4B32|nr:sigma factor-like helix-turn-helix DNA-binding protein [Aerococcus urinae]MDK6688344.1 hypothetical protein [Aerococcus urinae]
MQNRIVKTYQETGSLRETAEVVGVGWQKVRKILITAEVYGSRDAEDIKALYQDGFSEQEIADLLGLSISTVNSYLPYSKGEYNSDDPTINALRIRKSRNKKEGPESPS